MGDELTTVGKFLRKERVFTGIEQGLTTAFLLGMVVRQSVELGVHDCAKFSSEEELYWNTAWSDGGCGYDYTEIEFSRLLVAFFRCSLSSRFRSLVSSLAACHLSPGL